MTQHDKLFVLYAANIAAIKTHSEALDLAEDQLDYFNARNIFDPTPPAQEETGPKYAPLTGMGIYVARLENGYQWQTPVEGGLVCIQEIRKEFAEQLVGVMKVGDEPRKVKTN